MLDRARSIRRPAGAALALLAACANTVDLGTGSAGSATGTGGESASSASGTGGESASSTSGIGGATGGTGGTGGGSATSGSSSSSGSGGSPVGVELAIDVYPDDPFGDAGDVAVDGSGNIFVTVGASPMLGPAPGYLGTLLTKYSPTGQVLWQKLYKPGGPSQPLFDWLPAAHLTSIAVDATGALYAAGEVQGQLDLGGVIVDSGLPTFAKPNVYVEFLFKLDPAGNLLWHKEFADTCLGGRATASPSGQILYTCTTLPADLGGGVLPGKLSIASYDAEGAYLWGRGLGSGIDVGVTMQDLAPTPAGDWVITGYFAGQLDFGGGFALDGGMVSHLLVARLDGPSGATVWAKQFGDDLAPAWTGPNTVAVDAQGDVIVGGLFYTSVDFGGGLLVNTEPMQGISDGFLAKLAGGDGSHLWSLAIGGKAPQQIAGVAATSAGEILIAASYTSQLQLAGVTYPAPDLHSMLLAHLSTTAPPQVLDVATFGSITPSPGAIAATPKSIALAGNFNGTLDFGPTSITSNKNTDPFLLVLAP